MEIFSLLYPLLLPGDVPTNHCDCNCTFTSNAAGTVVSPGYPNDYDNERYCQYSITQDDNIVLTFTDMAIEEQSDCNYDNLKVQFLGLFIYRVIKYVPYVATFLQWRIFSLRFCHNFFSLNQK